MRLVAAAAGAFAVAMAASASLASSPCLREAGKEWRDGPARYLLTEEEWTRFGRLDTDEARAAFMERFWKRIESGASPTAEPFRERFERRCLEADTRFARDEPRGWRSDRGRVLLLLGEPASIEELPGEAESIGREIWIYPFFGDASVGGVEGSSLRITFYRAFDGRFRLEPPRARTSVGTPVVFDAIKGRVRAPSRSIGPLRGNPFGAFVDAVLTRPAVERGPAKPPVTAAPPPPQDRRVGSSSLHDGAWFFQAADGSVLAMLAVAVAPGSGLNEGSVRGSAFVVDGAAAGRGEAGGQVALAPAPSSGAGRPLHVGRVHLEPGAGARVRFVFTDASRETMLVTTRRLEVPELGTGGFAVSSVVPAESFGPLPDGFDSVFAVGSEMVVPRPEAAFARGETLRLYLQVYGATSDPATMRPRIDVTYRFLRDTGRRFVRHGRPFRLRGASGESLGLSIPVGDWPVGGYRVEVDLRDRVAGRLVRSEAEFKITE